MRKLNFKNKDIKMQDCKGNKKDHREMNAMNVLGTFVPNDTALFSQETLDIVDKAVAGEAAPSIARSALSLDFRDMTKEQWLMYLKHCEKRIEDNGQMDVARHVAFTRVMDLGTDCLVDNLGHHSRNVRKDVRRDIGTIDDEIDSITAEMVIERYNDVHHRIGVSYELVNKMSVMVFEMAVNAVNRKIGFSKAMAATIGGHCHEELTLRNDA